MQVRLGAFGQVGIALRVGQGRQRGRVIRQRFLECTGGLQGSHLVGRNAGRGVAKITVQLRRLGPEAETGRRSVALNALPFTRVNPGLAGDALRLTATDARGVLAGGMLLSLQLPEIVE